MATGYYQTPQSPRLYVSYLLYAHAVGGLKGIKAEKLGGNYGIGSSALTKLIDLDISFKTSDGLTLLA